MRTLRQFEPHCSNPRQIAMIGMNPLNSTPIWDEYGRGRGARDLVIGTSDDRGKNSNHEEHEGNGYSPITPNP
jgi:hypothetical protein